MISNLLVIRFSAMGDVAMTVPVISSLATAYPQMRITVLTRDRLPPMFSWMPSNVEVRGIDLGSYEGLGGLGKLFSEISKEKFDAVADIHDVLRSKYLRFRFRLKGIKTAVIDKGRKEKKELIGRAMSSASLKPMSERYRDVFVRLGLPFEFTYTPPAIPHDSSVPPHSIGIAPFAAYDTKIYPLDKMHQVVTMLASQGRTIYLFGAGKKEKEILEKWEQANVISVCGNRKGLKAEMQLMSQLDAMLCMDSANMHIASIMGTRVVSVWGATHPKAGFLAWGQSTDDVCQKDMPCRPCSVYGNKPCTNPTPMACMNCISPEQIIEKLLQQ